MIDYMKTSDQLENKYKQNKNPLFVDYKFYNKSQSRGNKNDTKKYIVKEKSNRYSYCGKIKEFSFETIFKPFKELIKLLYNFLIITLLFHTHLGI